MIKGVVDGYRGLCGIIFIATVAKKTLQPKLLILRMRHKNQNCLAAGLQTSLKTIKPE